jgi:hypothetical protein
MALVGGGGAGNIAGGAGPSSTGTTLQYVGDRVYCYTGETTTSATQNEDKTHMDFTVQEAYELNFLICNTFGGTDDIGFKFVLNGEISQQFLVQSANTTNEPPNTVRLIVTPQTRVQLKSVNFSAAAARKFFASIVGRRITNA